MSSSRYGSGPDCRLQEADGAGSPAAHRARPCPLGDSSADRADQRVRLPKAGGHGALTLSRIQHVKRGTGIFRDLRACGAHGADSCRTGQALGRVPRGLGPGLPQECCQVTKRTGK
ncbi:hypothetical protein AAFF_G00258570 [Aldrovandia affinis]|uniref:Uncharacterized protein n=1 Tax=Aldrovandia affinis TaxID=143900 RepID=A0AAD7STL1_9TELE|nr:hypothetical protein AAFF_G00258570 [Aldrovandia affinis]